MSGVPESAQTWCSWGWGSWLRLFRGIGLASDVRKLLLTVLGLALTWSGWEGLDRAFPDSAGRFRMGFERMRLGEVRPAVEPFVIAATRLADPIRLPLTPGLPLFDLGGGNARFAHAILAALWTLAVWSLVGGAIVRLTVLELATGRRHGLAGGLRFGLQKSGALLSAPLALLVALGGFGLLCGGLGLLYQGSTTVGLTIAGALAFVPLLLGLVMTWLLIWFVLGWPLMVAAVAAEDDDGFDALSRSHSYVFQSPWRYALYVGLAWGIGTAGWLLVVLAARVVQHLALWGLAIGAPDATVAQYYGPLTVHPESAAAALHSGWLALVTVLVYGWVYSYFWSATGQIYLLLRRDVDGTPLDVVANPVGGSGNAGSG